MQVDRLMEPLPAWTEAQMQAVESEDEDGNSGNSTFSEGADAVSVHTADTSDSAKIAAEAAAKAAAKAAARAARRAAEENARKVEEERLREWEEEDEAWDGMEGTEVADSIMVKAKKEEFHTFEGLDELVEDISEPPYMNAIALRNITVRKQPLLLLLSTDLPTHGRKQLLRSLECQLEGVCSLLPLSTPQLDLPLLQQHLDSGHNISHFVDIGLTASSRAAPAGWRQRRG